MVTLCPQNLRNPATPLCRDIETSSSTNHDEGWYDVKYMEEQEKLGNSRSSRKDSTNGYSIPHWIQSVHGNCHKYRTSSFSYSNTFITTAHFSKQPSSIQVAGTRIMHVQPTALSRRREGITKVSKMAPSGRPPKHPLSELDPNSQVNRGRFDHAKRKQNLRLNEAQNQANHHKHAYGRGH